MHQSCADRKAIKLKALLVMDDRESISSSSVVRWSARRETERRGHMRDRPVSWMQRNGQERAHGEAALRH